MIVTIHQPDFMPWLGFFDRWRQSGVLVLLDDAQFIRRGWHNRDKIKTPHGVKWLTVPVLNKGRYTQAINRTELDPEGNWRAKHLRTIADSYRKAPGFADLYPKVEAAYQGGHSLLGEFNTRLLELFAREMGIATPWVRASTLASGQGRSARLLDLVLAVGGTAYLSGLGAKEYLDEALFARAGIEVIWQRFDHPVYPQLHGPFEAGLSALDWLMMRPGEERTVKARPC